MDNGKWILSRGTVSGLRDYISAVPGDGGKDWEYTTDPGKALACNSYWQRRFLKDMAKVPARGPLARLVFADLAETHKRQFNKEGQRETK